MSLIEINKAIVAVMQEVRGIEKNSRVGSGNAAYDGTKDKDVKEAFSAALANNGLCIVPTAIEESTEIHRWEIDGQYSKQQKQSVFTKVKTKYLLIHDSGESIELAGYGHGVDPQDKAAGKALTYALKNTLLYTFLTPVGKIDDSETTHSNDIATPPAKPKAPEATAPEAPKPTPSEAAEAMAVKNADKSWFELVWPWSAPEKCAKKPLSDIAANANVDALTKMKDHFGKLVTDKTPELVKYVEKVEEALTEAKFHGRVYRQQQRQQGSR